MTHFVYALGLANELTKPYDKCYIGVTSNLWKRFREHRYRDSKDFIAENSLTFQNMIVIAEGSEYECYEIERQMRPKPNMGRNVSPGGRGTLRWRDTTGANNVKAKTWIITDPCGEQYNVTGQYDKFCKDHNILSGTLRRSNGPVPPLERKFGGFRAKNEDQLEQRINTTGWSFKIA
jgi:predicted GIY-YIG superfamily endonuclease